jgi:hypothetical protein
MPPTDPQINNVWGQAVPVDTSVTITLPSGQVCKAKRLGMEGILTAGLLGDADSLTAYVGRKHVRKVKGGKGADTEAVNVRSLANDPEALKKVVFLVDRATPHIVSEPKVHLHLEFLEDGDTRMIPVEEREEGEIYTDMIGLEDKMFLFQFAVGGSGDLERFRGESEAALEDLSDGEDVQRTPVAGTPSGGGGKRRRPRRRQ